MNTLYLKGIVLAMIVAGLLWYRNDLIDDAYNAGKNAAMEEYFPQITALSSLIDQGDAKAKEQQIQQEKNYETVKIESDRRAADITRYKRMLSNQVKASRNANLPQISGGTSPITDADGIGCSPEYRIQCLEVINRAVTCRDLIILNKFPLR